jgi:hypothetical protein
VRAQGLDVRFGIATAVMQLFAMAPLSAAAVVVMARVLGALGFPPQTLPWLALVYGFGTPIFFRTGFLNQNLLVAHFAFFSFALLAGASAAYPSAARLAAAGAMAGLTLLCDYTGIVLIAALFAYAIYRCGEDAAGRFAGLPAAIARALPMAAGAVAAGRRIACVSGVGVRQSAVAGAALHAARGVRRDGMARLHRRPTPSCCGRISSTCASD